MKKHKHTVAYMTYSMVVAAMVISGIGLTLPYLEADIGLTELQQGSLVSVQFLGFTIMVLIGGILADLFGKALLYRIALAGVFAGSIVLIFSKSYAMVVVAIACMGAFGAIMESEAIAIATDCEPDKKQEANLAIQVGFNAGAMIIPLIFYFSPIINLSWKTVFAVECVLTVSIFVLSARLINKKESVDIRGVFREWGNLFRKPKYLIAPVAMFLYMYSEVLLWGFVPTYVAGSGGSYFSSVIATICLWGSMAVGRILSVTLLKRMSMVTAMKLFALISFVGVTALAVLPATMIIPVALLCGFGFGPFFPFIISWMQDITGSNSSSMISATMAIGSLGPIVCGVVSGWLNGNFGVRMMLAVPPVCFLLIGILLLAFGKLSAAKN